VPQADVSTTESPGCQQDSHSRKLKFSAFKRGMAGAAAAEAVPSGTAAHPHPATGVTSKQRTALTTRAALCSPDPSVCTGWSGLEGTRRIVLTVARRADGREPGRGPVPHRPGLPFKAAPGARGGAGTWCTPRRPRAGPRVPPARGQAGGHALSAGCDAERPLHEGATGRPNPRGQQGKFCSNVAILICPEPHADSNCC